MTDPTASDLFTNEQLSRMGALSATTEALGRCDVYAGPDDLIPLARWILDGGDVVVNGQPLNLDPATAAGATASEDGEGWLYDFEDLENQPDGTIIRDRDGDTIACTEPVGSTFRWIYVDPKQGQIDKPMTSAEVVFEGKGPWRIVEPVSL